MPICSLVGANRPGRRVSPSGAIHEVEAHVSGTDSATLTRIRESFGARKNVRHEICLPPPGGSPGGLGEVTFLAAEAVAKDVRIVEHEVETLERIHYDWSSGNRE